MNSIKLFSILHFVAFTCFIVILSFDKVFIPYEKLILLASLPLFFIFGFLSVFKKSIWNEAHSKSRMFLDNYKYLASAIVLIIMGLTISSDLRLIPENFDQLKFLSWMVIYLIYLTPSYVYIMGGETKKLNGSSVQS